MWPISRKSPNSPARFCVSFFASRDKIGTVRGGRCLEYWPSSLPWQRASILDYIARGLAQAITVPNVRQRGPGIAVPGKILEVNDIGAALTGVGESRYSEGVHGNCRIQSQKFHVAFYQKLHG